VNSQQRRQLRRAAERKMQRLNISHEKATQRPLSWPMVLLYRASDQHFNAVVDRKCWPDSRRARHLFAVLNDHKFAVHGVRYPDMRESA